jgi:hypothetical protein
VVIQLVLEQNKDVLIKLLKYVLVDMQQVILVKDINLGVSLAQQEHLEHLVKVVVIHQEVVQAIVQMVL